MSVTIITIVLLGYLVLGRSFAYLGVPQLHLFIGEVALGCFLIASPDVAGRRWPWSALHTDALRRFTKVFLIFFVFGLFQMFRGIFAGHPIFTAMRDLAFNYYPLYFFVGIYAGLVNPEILPRIFRIAGWINGLYGILFVLVLSRLPWLFPGVPSDVDPVSIFGQPSFSAVILLGLLSFEKDYRRIWPVLLLNASVLLGMLIRAEWLAFAVGLGTWAWCTGNIKKALALVAAVVVLLGLMYVTNFSYAGPETRGRTISAKDVVGQVIAPFNRDLAASYISDALDTDLSEGTTVFRLLYWAGVWDSVHESAMRALLGYGYGFSLGNVVEQIQIDARTPHNLFFYALGYTGWVGVILTILFLGELFRLLWRVRQQTGNPFPVVLWVTIIAFSMFTPFFEAPQGAIPFYLIAGCCCAVLLYAPSKAAQLENSTFTWRSSSDSWAHVTTWPLG